jgi:excisionase family DNA binding protein
MDLLMTKREAASFLRVSVRTVERWVCERKVPFVRLPGRGGIRFRQKALLRWVENRGVRPVQSEKRVLPHRPSGKEAEQ